MERMESNSEKDHEYRTGRSRRCGGDSDFGGVDCAGYYFPGAADPAGQ